MTPSPPTVIRKYPQTSSQCKSLTYSLSDKTDAEKELKQFVLQNSDKPLDPHLVRQAYQQMFCE